MFVLGNLGGAAGSLGEEVVVGGWRLVVGRGMRVRLVIDGLGARDGRGGDEDVIEPGAWDATGLD